MEDQNPSSSNARRQRKFQPKIIPKQEQRILKPKIEPTQTAEDNVINHNLIKLVKQAEEGLASTTIKRERKIVQGNVSFGYVDTRKGGFGASRFLKQHSDDKDAKTKEYEDVWNYDSYYPVTLPLRVPYSGNPEILDREEFGEDRPAYDESCANAARDLGLTTENEGRLLFFQFPSSLPKGKRPPGTAAKGKEDADLQAATEGSCRLEELPAGFMGKLLVYKSGRINMKLGDSLFDVSPGSECMFAEDVMAINPAEKTCCILEEVTKRAIVTPDLDSLLATETTPDY